MSSDEGLRYSFDGKLNFFYFNNNVDSIHIFTEDLGQEHKYEKILKKVMGEDKNLIDGKSIYSIGSKKDVIKAYEKIGGELNGKKCFYLIDGDFDNILDEEKLEVEQVSYLKKYNIETYLINEVAIFKLIQPHLEMIEEEAKNNFNYKKWRNRIVKEGFKLFSLFIYIQKEEENHKNVSASFRYIDNKTGFLKENAINEILDKIELNIEEWEKEEEEIYQKHLAVNGKDKKIRLICGKFLIQSLRIYFRNEKNIILENNNRVEWLLIENMDIKPLEYIKNKIVDIMI